METNPLLFIITQTLINMSTEDEPKTVPAEGEEEEDAGDDVPAKEEESTATFEPVVRFL